jgi:hypothetical protein
VAGAQWERSLLEIFTEAGFTDVEVVAWTGYRTSYATQGAVLVANVPAVRAT